MKDVDKYIGIKMRSIRKKHLLTLAQVAPKLKCSHVYVHKMEKGEGAVTSNTVYLFCRVFNVTPNDLFPKIKSLKSL